jgi:hypothetical protein
LGDKPDLFSSLATWGTALGADRQCILDILPTEHA